MSLLSTKRLVKAPVGQAGPAEDVLEEQRRLRHVGGVLEQADVAHHERRRGEAHDLPQREVPRHDGQHRRRSAGSARTSAMAPVAMGSSASSDSACSANQRRPRAHFDASARAEANVLPISVVTMRAMSGASPSNRSAALIRWRARSAKLVVRYSRKVSAARCRIASTSAGVCAGNVFSVWPVAGLIVA